MGAGIGGLEYFIKTESPDLHTTSTDYAPEATERLARVFSECASVLVFDMLNDPWRRTPCTLYLLHRVETELSDRQWRSCFRRMQAGQVSPVLVIPSEFLTPERRAQARRTYFSHLRRRQQLTFSGYRRTKSRFMSLWSPSYRVLEECPVGDLTGFLIARSRRSALGGVSFWTAQQPPEPKCPISAPQRRTTQLGLEALHEGGSGEVVAFWCADDAACVGAGAPTTPRPNEQRQRRRQSRRCRMSTLSPARDVPL